MQNPKVKRWAAPRRNLIRVIRKAGNPSLPRLILRAYQKQQTVFGWILTGIVDSSSSDSSKVAACHTVTESSLSRTLVKFWEIEEIPSKKHLTPAEEYCVGYFADTTYRNRDGRFVGRLLFSQRENFPDSRDIAVACLRRSEKRRSRDANHDSAYSAFMNEYEQLGHMRVTSAPTAGQSHYYLPHHGVYRAATNKIRVVFNASQKTRSGLSLNDVLLPGPKLQPDITLVITRWRFNAVAITTVIVKMFRQFLGHEEDLDWQRLVWRESSQGNIRDYVALTVTYGMTSAPFLGMSALLRLAEDGEKLYPEACYFLKNQTYTDDIFLGADDTQQALAVQDQLIELLATAGIQLGKWASNDSTLIEGLQRNEVCDLPSAPEDVVSTLGLRWDTRSDSFGFSTTLPPLSAHISKKAVLSDTARLFDPLGFISPVLIKAKILLQDLWLHKLDWDDPLPRDVLDRWMEFRSFLADLPLIRIPRWTSTSSSSEWHLHGFADASMRAYAAVIFAVVPGHTPVILMAKTRVAPTKVETLPRLELCAATLLVRLASHLSNGALRAPVTINFWSDSKVVLDWLRSHPSRWTTFIANRVSEITTTFPDALWRHVRSKDNPADCASRRVSPSELASLQLWWSGPAWLADPPSQWSTQPEVIPSISEALFVQGQEKTSLAAGEDALTAFEKMSSFSKIIRTLAYCLRWRSRTRDAQRCSTPEITAVEYSASRIRLFRLIQHRAFSTEILCLLAGKSISSSSPLARLSPFTDEQGLLRVGGRLQNSGLNYSERHPIILPGRCYFVKLLVCEIHRATLHGGIQLMKSVLSRSYWIVRGNRLIAGVYHRCPTCTAADGSAALRPSYATTTIPDHRAGLRRSVSHPILQGERSQNDEGLYSDLRLLSRQGCSHRGGVRPHDERLPGCIR